MPTAAAAIKFNDARDITVDSSDGGIVRQARHDHVRLHRERSRAWRHSGAVRG